VRAAKGRHMHCFGRHAGWSPLVALCGGSEGAMDASGGGVVVVAARAV
jgi:hypothetical protein